MKRILIVLMVLLSAFIAIGCTGYDSGDDGAVVEDGEADGVQISASDLYVQITEDDDYSQWELWPGVGEMSESARKPHGDLITVYVSDTALSAIENKEGLMPNGSLVVKDGFDSDGELKEIVVMYKVDDFDPDHNDWFWAAYSPEGEVVVEGEVGGCINCHSAKKSNDYLFSGDLS